MSDRSGCAVSRAAQRAPREDRPAARSERLRRRGGGACRWAKLATHRGVDAEAEGQTLLFYGGRELGEQGKSQNPEQGSSGSTARRLVAVSRRGRSHRSPDDPRAFPSQRVQAPPRSIPRRWARHQARGRRVEPRIGSRSWNRSLRAQSVPSRSGQPGSEAELSSHS